MNNKSCKREFRVMSNGSLYILYRYLGWRKIFGWFKVTYDNDDNTYVKYFWYESAALQYVSLMIDKDNSIHQPLTEKQVWPQVEEVRRQM